MRRMEDRYISLLTDTPRELREYEDSRKAYRDLKNSLDTALRQGHAKGLEEGLEQGHAKGLQEGRAEGETSKGLEIARKLKADGMPFELIQKYTGLSIDDISRL